MLSYFYLFMMRFSNEILITYYDFMFMTGTLLNNANISKLYTFFEYTVQTLYNSSRILIVMFAHMFDQENVDQNNSEYGHFSRSVCPSLW